MTDWTVDQLLEATQGALIVGDGGETAGGVGIDSRRLKPRQVFVAIRGPRFDGHAFLHDAVGRGASCLIVSQRPAPAPKGLVRGPAAPPTVPTILVPDTTKALGDLAAFHRRRFSIPVIAVTGSCGKTTTKELIAHLLSGSASVLKTVGTENNHIGLPMTLLRLAPTHRYAVVELGSNHPGEIAYLARVARPTVAVITNIGPAHLEFFGSVEAIRQEKLSLLDALDPTGAAIIHGDQLDVLLEAKSRLRRGMTLLTFGSSDQCGVQVVETRRETDGFSMRLRGTLGEFHLPLPGFHNVENTLAALACVKAVGLSLESVRDRLREMPPMAMRSELVRCNGLTIINDCYNANPLSFARALELLNDLDVVRRVLIAGDMLELGPFAVTAHQTIGRLAAQSGIDTLLAVGVFAEEIARGALAWSPTPPSGGVASACAPVGRNPERPRRSGGVEGSRSVSAETYRTVRDLLPVLPSRIHSGDGILIKGSRNVQLEQVTALLRTLGPEHE